jgi:hypothetical protein
MRIPNLSPSVERGSNASFMKLSGLLNHQFAHRHATLPGTGLIQRLHFVAPLFPPGDLCFCYGLDSLDRCRLYLGSCWDCAHNINPC